MEIELDGALIELRGDSNPVVSAALEALLANGGHIAEGELPNILLLSYPLLPEPLAVDARTLVGVARATAKAMAERGGGRIVIVLSALAGMPMRRHPEYSLDMAAALAGMRTLAMEFGPKVLVNAVGLGTVEAERLVAGDTALLSHAALGRAGTLEEAVAPILFFCDPLNSYTTGQLLAVDGGWSAGYGRNF